MINDEGKIIELPHGKTRSHIKPEGIAVITDVDKHTVQSDSDESNNKHVIGNEADIVQGNADVAGSSDATSPE